MRNTNREIELPFLPEFKEPMLSGKKTATTRTRRFGYPGDWFRAFNNVFVFTEVPRIYLDIAARYYYIEEGFGSSQAFVECWNKLHPVITYQRRPSRVVYLHRFTPKFEATGRTNA